MQDWTALYRLDENAENPVAVDFDGDSFSFHRMTAQGDTVFAVGDEGTLSAMTLSEKGLSAPQPLAALPWTQDEDNYTDCVGLVADENALWALLSVSNMSNVYSDNALYRVDKQNGEVQKADVPNLIDLCEYKEGLLLALQWDRKADYQSLENLRPALVVIHKADFTVEPLTTLSGDDMGAPAYDPQTDVIYVASPSKLIGISNDLVQETCAYLALGYRQDGRPTLLWKGRYLTAAQDEPLGFADCPTDPSLLSTQVLKLGSSYMSEATRDFCKQHPEIAVELTEEAFYTPERIINDMVAASDEIDIYSVYLDFGSFTQLVKKGYCLDLSQSKLLTDTVGRMYPQLTQHCYNEQGKLCILPTSASVSAIGYSPTALKKLGLTEGELPRTCMELLDFAELWVQDYADNDAELMLFDTLYDIRSQLLYEITNQYIKRQLMRGEALTFDTPLYRSLLTKLDDITPSIEELNEETEDYGEIISSEDESPALLTFYGEVNPRGYQIYDYVPLNLTVEAGDEPTFTASQNILIANPYTKNQDAVMQYLEFVAQHIPPSDAVVLFPDANEPVEEDFYQEEMKGLMKDISDLEQRLNAADVEQRKALEDELANLKGWQENLEAERWRISAEEIARYREIAPNVLLNADNVLSYSNIASVISRYCDQQLTPDQCADELERVLRLIYLENE